MSSARLLQIRHIVMTHQLLSARVLTGGGDMSDPNLLLALFFSICSLWCTCQSSSSFLAFSLHSASAALDAESVFWGAQQQRGTASERHQMKRRRQESLINIQMHGFWIMEKNWTVTRDLLAARLFILQCPKSFIVQGSLQKADDSSHRRKCVGYYGLFAHLVLPGVSSVPPSTCVNSRALASGCPPGRWLHSCLSGHWTPFIGTYDM